MKLLRMRIEGFGPFHRPQEVNFGPCNEAGLFMVSGPTGAGKTTLLDAIAFALYGETTGAGQGSGESDGRKAGDLRCMACTPDDPTSVELDFEVSGVRYRISRNPEYTRTARRGPGTAKESADARVEQFEAGQWVPIEGLRRISDVGAFIELKLGLTAEQFRRVVVIPQGRFREVLLSAPDERQELLKRIFGTGIYERFTELVKARAAMGKRELETVEFQKRTILDGYEWTVGLDLGAVQQEALRRHGVAKAEHQDAKRSEEAFDEAQKAADQSRTAAAQTNARIDLLEKSRADRDKARSALASLQSMREALEASCRARPAVAAIESERKAKLRLKSASDELREAKSSQAEHAPRRDAAKEALAVAAGAQTQGAATLGEEQGRIAAELVQLTAQLDMIDRAKEKHDALRKAVSKASAASKEKRQHAEGAAKRVSSAQESLKRAQDEHRANRAGLMARALVPGCACPVCGSASHPAPARLTTGAVDDALVERREEDLRAARSLELEALDGLRTEGESLKVAEAALRDFEASLANRESPDEVSLREKIDAKKLRVEEIDRERSSLKDAVAKAQDAEHAARRGYEDADAAVLRLTGVVEAEKEAFQSATSLREREMTRIGETDPATVESLLRPAEWEDEARRKIDDADRNLISLEAAVALREKEVGTAVRADIAPLDEAVRVADQQLVDARSESTRAFLAVADLGRLVDSIGKVADRAAMAESKFRPAHELAQVILGATGEARVSLHAWVLGAFLDEVLAVASERLHDMTRGRYELRRMAGQLDGRQEAGLNLEVFDSHTGAARPARTLSGGETFLASLALALALAEVAGDRGGRALDTVFIDEGFGSLDAETLDTAMDVLNRLKESGRSVGLISHVDEMKRRIPTRIEVIKDSDSGTSRLG